MINNVKNIYEKHKKNRIWQHCIYFIQALFGFPLIIFLRILPVDISSYLMGKIVRIIWGWEIYGLFCAEFDNPFVSLCSLLGLFLLNPKFAPFPLFAEIERCIFARRVDVCCWWRREFSCFDRLTLRLDICASSAAHAPMWPMSPAS